MAVQQKQTDSLENSNNAASTQNNDVARRILDENRQTTSTTSGTTDQTTNGQTEQKTTTASGTTVSESTGINDGTNGIPVEDTEETPEEQMRREVAGVSAQERRNMLQNGELSPTLAAAFGLAEIFDPNAEGQTEGQTENSEGGVFNAITGAITDTASWAVNAINENIVEPVQNGLTGMLETFTNSDWSFENLGHGIMNMASSLGLDSLNDATVGDFNEQQRDTRRDFRFDLEGAQQAGTGEEIRVPEGSVEDGTVNVGGNQLTVLRSPDGRTFLRNGDRVVAEQGADGSYNLMLNDGSRLDFKLNKGENGEYNLAHLERSKDGRLQQKFADGVYYSYNYDSQGNRTSVDAAADLNGPMTQEQLDQRLNAIRQELGANGTAALRINNNGERSRLLMQTHGDQDRYSITDIDNHRARVFDHGTEYRINEHDQLGVVNPDGSFSQLDRTNPNIDERVQGLLNLMDQIGRRAHGDSDARVDGVGVRVEDNGDAHVDRRDPETGEQISETVLPQDENQPITVTNEVTGDTTTIEGEKLEIRDADGNTLVEFDPQTGLRTDEFKVDDQGLTDLESGLNLDPDGMVFDGDGNFISDGYDEWFGPDSAAEIQSAENEQLSNETCSTVQSLGSLSLSISRCGNPGSVAIAKQVASMASNVASAALAELGNDLQAKIPIYYSESIADAAFVQAVRQERTQTAAMRMGISDTTRLSEYNRLATLTSTTYTPEEYVNWRARRDMAA